MADSSKRLRQVAGQTADVSTLGADHLKRRRLIGHPQKGQAVDGQLARGERDGLASPGQRIGTFAVDLQGRIGRGIWVIGPVNCGRAASISGRVG